MNMRHFKRSSLSCIIIMPFVVIAIISMLALLPSFPNGIPKAYAHAFTIRSDPSPSQSLPTPPTKVDVYFSEPIDLRYSTIKVLDAGGKQIDNKDERNIGGDPASLSVTLPSSPLKDGVYTVSTKVLSATDGHVVDNAFVFGIGQTAIPSGQHSNSQFGSQSQLYIPNAIARFPAYVGQVLVVGAAFASIWIWKPFSEVRWLNDTIIPLRNRIDRSLVILMVIGSAILVVSDFGIIYVQASDLGTGINEAIGTKFGSVWVMRTIESFILLAVSLGIYLKRVRKTIKSAVSISPSKGEVASLLVIGLAILATTTLIGHGATSGQILPIAIDFIHNLAASLWIGGIIYLAFVVAPKIKSADTLEENVKASTLSIIIPRFSTIPVTILGVIVVTGPFLLYFIENNLDVTLASLYGKWLIVKLSLAAIMIAIGGYNQRIIQRDAVGMSTATSMPAATIKSPRGARHGRGGGEQVEIDSNNNNNNNHWLKKPKKTSVVSKFVRTTKVEAIVGIALLAAVALLVNTGTPGSEFQGQQQQQSANALTATNSANGTTVSQQQHFISTRFVEGGNRVILSIDPFTPGTNNFKISFLDAKNNPLDIRSVQIRYTQIEKGIGPINVNTTEVSKGVFSANAAFGLPGQWNLEVEAIQNKLNALNIVTSYDLFIKPRLDQLNFNVQEYKIPQNNSQPLYPLFDKSKNAIWVGDTAIDSGRMWEYNLASSKYIEHKVAGVSIVTVMALDSHNQLWFVDPIMKNLGQYDPSTGKSSIFKLPTQGVVSGITVNKNDNNIWITAPVDNKVIRFNPQTSNFTAFTLPTANAQPFGIIADQISGQIWIAEGVGKIANIDPSNKNKITEYAPTRGRGNEDNSTLKSPTALFADPITANIYISQHDGHTVSIFNPLLKTFKDFPSLDPNGLPFGMAMDSSYRNLWVAEHTINKIAVIDPRTGTSKELTIPNQTSIVQWVTADLKGNIWLAEQRGNSLAVITSSPKVGQSSYPANPATAEVSQVNTSNNNNVFNLPPLLGLSYAAVVGPSVAGGIIVSAIFYIKSIIDLKQNVRRANKRHKNDISKP
jgi:copper transport protein